jgi:hypothetical protein
MDIVPIAILLTISFFVLFAIRRVEEKGLKAFGYVVTGFLWLAAVVIFLSAVANVSRNHFSIKYGMQSPAAKMNNMRQMMSPPQFTPNEIAPSKNLRPECSKCKGNRGVIFKTE